MPNPTRPSPGLMEFSQITLSSFGFRPNISYIFYVRICDVKFSKQKLTGYSYNRTRLNAKAANEIERGIK